MSSLAIQVPDPRENRDGQPRSWSQYANFRSCAKSWQLAKLRRAPRRPGVWLPAGTAVHAVIEMYLLKKAEEESA